MQIIRNRTTEDTGIKTCKAAVKEALTPAQEKERREWVKEALKISAERWKRTVWLDELHFGVGKRYVRHTKRAPNQRFRDDCI